MLHAKIIDTSKNESIEISKAENFLNQSKFGAIIYFVGTVRDLNENKAVTGITYDTKDIMVIRSFLCGLSGGKNGCWDGSYNGC